ncbi:MAG TPA: hypothetical protein VFW03_11290 [Gemmatimonadaceae bacterium]|nr:hypothetical protein [Gemmatimonadaceae bacterium]
MRVITLGGVALLLAAAPGGRTRGPAASYLFGGRIIAADSGSLDGVHVIATDARGTYEALIDSSGTFVGAFPTQPSSRVTLRVFSDSTAPRYHTSVVTLDAGAPGGTTRIVLVPRRWRVRGGPFDGREVPIDPARATTRFGDGPGYWRVSRRSGRAVSWVADSFPIRIAFRHAAGDPFISPNDSVRFWELATSLERLLGRTLFRPASFEEVDAGADGIFVTVNRRMAAAGKTYITYDGSGRIYEALLTVSQNAYLGEPRVAMHELLHAMGFGHTGGWPSIMGPNAGGIESPTAEDVAYAQLYYAISELQRNREAPFGIPESAR